ncbi:MBL fold metallo-hydrolase [Streptomyces sp. NPDC002619]|uniref:MBL fold metallo-hydrolase n=1 Tax=Streptomyces sp. NPDC002619 TaxID=3364655 RepID=UPI0036A54D83
MAYTDPSALVRVTERVWLWPHHPDPDRVQASVGVIAGDDGCLVVDAGQSPAHARRVRESLVRQGFPPPQLLVYTHHHWDHVWGAQEWGVPVVAHEQCRQALLAEADKPWSEPYLRAEMAREPLLRPSFSARVRAMEGCWESFRIVLPDQTFRTRHVIELAGAAAELEHVGGRHTPDSIVVKVPSEGVIFLGDCYYPPPYHLRQPGDEPDLAMVRGLVNSGYAVYVESHDVPRSRQEAEAALNPPAR